MPDLQKGKSVSRLEIAGGEGENERCKGRKSAKARKNTQRMQNTSCNTVISSQSARPPREVVPHFLGGESYIGAPPPRSGSSLPGRRELTFFIVRKRGRGAADKQNRETQFLPKKEQHFIQGQHTRPKEGHPRGEEAEVTRSSLLLVSGLRHRPEMSGE